MALVLLAWIGRTDPKAAAGDPEAGSGPSGQVIEAWRGQGTGESVPASLLAAQEAILARRTGHLHGVSAVLRATGNLCPRRAQAIARRRLQQAAPTVLVAGDDAALDACSCVGDDRFHAFPER